MEKLIWLKRVPYFHDLIENNLVIVVNPQALMDYGTVMLLEDKPNIKVSVTATTSTQAMAAVLSLVVILFRSYR